MSVLCVTNLVKRYGRVAALNGFNLSVGRGETVVLTGPSGCGKSTALRCMNMLTKPDSGSVRFLGEELVGLPERELSKVRTRIGFVFQHFNLIDRLTAVENVMFAPVLLGTPVDEARMRADECLRAVGLPPGLARRPSELSGGERQRVAIARALATNPRLMLWDEPTAQLDPILVSEVLDIMERLARSRTVAMVVVTHEMRFTARIADRIALMDAGRVVEAGTPAEVLGSPRSELGRRYQRLVAS